MEDLKSKLENLIFVTANANCSNKPALLDNLAVFIDSWVKREVKRELHKFRSLKATAEYMNKAGKTQK